MKILIADDEPVTCRLLEWLTRKWGYDPVVVQDGQIAAWLLERHDAPRIALLDWMMPGLDGIAICKKVRSRPSLPYIYVVLLTAKTRKQDAIEGLEAGADDYVTKPFDPDELRARCAAGKRIIDYLGQASVKLSRPEAEVVTTEF